jgi:histidine triad (HIT) family protein
MERTVFSKIISGEIPCHKVYEDSLTFAFMDIAPIQPGMVVVVVKQQIDRFEDLSQLEASAWTATTQKIMKAMKKTFPSAARIGVRIEGFDVPHAHGVLVPLASPAEFRAEPPSGDPDHEKLAAIALKLREELHQDLQQKSQGETS